VFVLRCQSTSHLTCFVSFHRVHPSYAIIQSCSPLQFIQSYKSHSFIHSHHYTLTLSYINAYIYMISIPTWLHQSPKSCSIVSIQFGLYLSSCHAPSSNKRTACNHHFHQKCRPQRIWSRDVTDQSFQVAGPNNRTTCILPSNFYHMPNGKTEQPGQLASPFYHSIIPNGKTEQPNSLRLPFYFYHVSIRQS